MKPSRSLLTLMLASTLSLGAGCAARPAAAPVAPVAFVGPQQVELTLHDIDVAQAQSYARELERSGRYRSVKLRMESPSTARILATTRTTTTR